MYKAVPDQKHLKPVRPPLIPTGDELEQQEEGLFVRLRINPLGCLVVFLAENVSLS